MGQAVQGAYSRIDRAWADGLAGGINGRVASRMATALAGNDGRFTDDACGCTVGADGQIADPAHCPVVFKTGQETMAKVRAVAMVTPAEWALNLECFVHGDKTCVKDGMSYVGETCCRMVDRTFAEIRGDLNLYVVVPEPVARRIESYSFRETEAMEPVDPSCSLLVDDKAMAWSLPTGWRGFVARTWLYADRRYGATTPLALGVLGKISSLNPPEPWEIERARRIGGAQGGRSVLEGQR
jgi:endonuclease I